MIGIGVTYGKVGNGMALVGGGFCGLINISTIPQASLLCFVQKTVTKFRN